MPGYGLCDFGSFEYGGTCIETWEQGYAPNAKQDTVYLGDNDNPSGGLKRDNSQWGTDLGTIDGIPAIADHTGARFEHITTREISCRFKAVTSTKGATSNNGVMIRYGSRNAPFYDLENDQSYRVDKNGDELVFWHSGTAGAELSKLVLPSITSNEQDFSFAWSSRPNIFSGSVTDEQKHEAWIYNHNTGELTSSFFTSRNTMAAVPAGLWKFSLKGFDVAPIQGYDREISRVRIGSAFHDSVEFYEDYVALTPNKDFEADPEFEPLWIDRESGIGDEGQFWGPVVQQEAHFRSHFKNRMMSPLVNEAWSFAGDFQHPNQTSGTLWRTAPHTSASAGWRMYAGWMKWVDVPPFMPRKKVFWRAHYRTSGPSAGLYPKIGVRCYSMNEIPGHTIQGNLNNNINPNLNKPPFVAFWDEVIVDGGTGDASQGWVSGVLKTSISKHPDDNLIDTSFFVLAVSGSEAGQMVSFDVFTVQTIDVGIVEQPSFVGGNNKIKLG